MPEQQMNKLCVKTPFPNVTVAMKTLASTNNFLLARTVKLEVRTIDQLENVHRTALEHGRHSQREKVCNRQTILKGLPSYPSTVAVKIHNWQNNTSTRPRPVEHSRNEKWCPSSEQQYSSRLLFPHQRKSNNSHIKHTRL